MIVAMLKLSPAVEKLVPSKVRARPVASPATTKLFDAADTTPHDEMVTTLPTPANEATLKLSPPEVRERKVDVIESPDVWPNTKLCALLETVDDVSEIVAPATLEET